MSVNEDLSFIGQGEIVEEIRHVAYRNRGRGKRPGGLSNMHPILTITLKNTKRSVVACLIMQN